MEKTHWKLFETNSQVNQEVFNLKNIREMDFEARGILNLINWMHCAI